MSSGDTRSTMPLKTVCFFHLLLGVFGAEWNRTETLSVMVGDSLTLHTDIRAVRRNDHIVWMFGPDSSDTRTRIAEIMRWSYMLSIFVSGQMRFRDRLLVDHQTGSLTITGARSEHSGLYRLTLMNNRKTLHRWFSVKVYAPLPVPVISSVGAPGRSSGPACVLMCSVSNVTRATLSFYRGGDLLSSVSGSDSSSSLSLPLEVEDQDGHTYSCVVNNIISNHTTLLDSTDLCRTPADVSENLLLYCLLVLIPAALAVIGVISCVCRKHGKAQQQTGESG